LDARILADLLRADLVYESYVPTKEFREMRSLVRHRISLVRNRTMLENKVLSGLVFVHPGKTIVSILYIVGIILIVVGIEKIISGIFVGNRSRWGAVGLGVLALIFGSITVAAPVSTAVFVIFMLGFGLLFLGISHVVYGIGSKE